MKKIYDAPRFQIIPVEDNDILTTSPMDTDGDPDEVVYNW